MKYYIEIVSYFPSKDNFRGAFLYDQIVEIKKQLKVPVKVFKIVNQDSTENNYIIDGIEVIIIKSIRIPSNIFPYLFSSYNQFLFRKALKKNGIDIKEIGVVHCHDMHNSIYGNYLKNKNPDIKFFQQLHGLDVLQLKNGNFQNYLNKIHIINKAYKFCKNVDSIIGVSKLTLQQFEKYVSFNYIKKQVLYNGVNLQKFFPLEKSTIKHDTLVIGCVGNFNKIKDQITLLKAINELKDIINIKVIFVGSGPTLNECKTYSKENKLDNIEFINSISHDKLLHFYNGLDLFILPSIYESFGCVYVEAYACGVPFISVKGQGINEILQDSTINAFTIDPNDYKKLSSIILNYKASAFKLNESFNISIESSIKNFIECNNLNEQFYKKV